MSELLFLVKILYIKNFLIPGLVEDTFQSIIMNIHEKIDNRSSL